MIDRLEFREKLCILLQKEYVALLGQKGSDVETILRALINDKSPLKGMKFIPVALPRNVDDDKEFEELFLERLLEAANRVAPETGVRESVARTVQLHPHSTTNYRIRKALDTVGLRTSANYLVIILHALAEVAERPLKKLLHTLREYHEQINNNGEAGEKLRFLVAGGGRLWRLCFYGPSERSPFNIAFRVFVDSLSNEEIQKIDANESIETAAKLRDLTDGIPSLVEQAITGFADKGADDLSSFFKYLQDHWYALPLASREVMKNVAEGSKQFPLCQPDYRCPQIPEVESPWIEAFWSGFLRLRYRQLAWRSQIHQAFVMRYADVQDSTSKSNMVKADLKERTERLEKALKDVNYIRLLPQ